MNGKKICILTSAHRAFDTRIFHRQAKTLVRAGYEVVLIAQHSRNEVVEGVRIIALPTPKNRLVRIWGTWRVLRLAYKQKADIYHFHDPELLPVGMLLKLLTKAQVVYDVHEDYPKHTLSKYWLPPITRRPASFVFDIVEKSASLCLDYVVVATGGIARRFKGDKTATIQNFPTVELIEPKLEWNFRNPTVIYAGFLEEQSGITEIVHAMEYIDPLKNVTLVLCGRFSPESYELRVRSLEGFRRTEYLGWVEPEQLWRSMCRSNAGIVCYHPAPNQVESQPRKLFEYMAVGLPVIASNFPLYKEFVEENHCGITVDPLNPREIAAAIEYLVDHPDEARRMGENGRRAALEKYNWETESKKLLAVYESLLQAKSRRK